MLVMARTLLRDAARVRRRRDLLSSLLVWLVMERDLVRVVYVGQRRWTSDSPQRCCAQAQSLGNRLFVRMRHGHTLVRLSSYRVLYRIKRQGRISPRPCSLPRRALDQSSFARSLLRRRLDTERQPPQLAPHFYATRSSSFAILSSNI
jgi:hypothetical protein